MNAETKPYGNLKQTIKNLQTVFSQRVRQTKALRKVPEQSIQDLQDAGFFLALQPKEFGGLELSPQDFFDMQSMIAESCMSTAWASGIIAVHAFQLALMDKKAQEDVWKDDMHARISSSYAPMGKVERVEGGFKFSGRWGWSSGCDHCSWVLLGAIVPDEGYRTFLVPRKDYNIEDTWYSMGLEGTGSNDIIVRDAFVPDYRTHKQSDGFNLTNPGVNAQSADLYRIPWAQLFVRVVSTPAIGACKASVNIYKQEITKNKSMDSSKHAQDLSTLERIAQVENSIREMELALHHNFNEMQSAVKSGEGSSIYQRTLYRYQASLVIDKSIEAIDHLFSMAGGRSVFLGNEILQRFLDIHTARAHVANNPTNFSRNLGRVSLGEDTNDFFI